MKMTTLSITNFQSHKKTVFHLHPGVNVIIGETDKGKSAALRSFGWLAKNRSEDRSFRSRWGGKTDVETKFEDGIEISRVQNDKDPKNAYYLFDAVNNKDEEYKAFKTDIPEDIVQALNMSSINIQSQFDPPFLLSATGGEVAKTINKIADLTDIDESISSIKKLVLANSKDISTNETLLIDLEKQQEGFKYLLQMEKDVVQYEQLLQADKDLDEDHFALGLLISNINKNNVALNETDSFLKVEPELNAALALIEQEKQLTVQGRSLANAIYSIEDYKKRLATYDSLLSAENELNAALELSDALEELNKTGTALGRIIKQIQLNETQLKAANDDITKYTAKYKSEFPDVCPLCGGSEREL